jgi:hypothetical protein
MSEKSQELVAVHTRRVFVYKYERVVVKESRFLR